MENKGELILSIRDLKKSYDKNQVLNGINLDVYKGQIIGYIGPNGAGKSTTVKILLGIIQDYEGDITIFGEDIKKQGIEFKRRIGYVPENGEMYDVLTAKEYLTFIGELYGLDEKEVDYKAKRLMGIFGIGHAYESKISSYSKGMKQKVLIISSILHNPDILFLDEPLSGLDANSVMIVKEILLEFVSEGKTIFYSSHIMDVVEKISNRIVLIKDGQVIADGSFDELKKQCKQGSLENIFNQLTGFNKYDKLAKEAISIIKGEELYEEV